MNGPLPVELTKQISNQPEKDLLYVRGLVVSLLADVKQFDVFLFKPMREFNKLWHEALAYPSSKCKLVRYHVHLLAPCDHPVLKILLYFLTQTILGKLRIIAALIIQVDSLKRTLLRLDHADTMGAFNFVRLATLLQYSPQMVQC